MSTRKPPWLGDREIVDSVAARQTLKALECIPLSTKNAGNASGVAPDGASKPPQNRTE
jgi:hypothetical protein